MALTDEQKIEILSSALRDVADWVGKFPETGKLWPDGSPMSYGACFGSNGERDFMRSKAEQALIKIKS